MKDHNVEPWYVPVLPAAAGLVAMGAVLVVWPPNAPREAADNARGRALH